MSGNARADAIPFMIAEAFPAADPWAVAHKWDEEFTKDARQWLAARRRAEK